MLFTIDQENDKHFNPLFRPKKLTGIVRFHASCLYQPDISDSLHVLTGFRSGVSQYAYFAWRRTPKNYANRIQVLAICRFLDGWQTIHLVNLLVDQDYQYTIEALPSGYHFYLADFHDKEWANREVIGKRKNKLLGYQLFPKWQDGKPPHKMEIELT